MIVILQFVNQKKNICVCIATNAKRQLLIGQLFMHLPMSKNLTGMFLDLRIIVLSNAPGVIVCDL